MYTVFLRHFSPIGITADTVEVETGNLLFFQDTVLVAAFTDWEYFTKA